MAEPISFIRGYQIEGHSLSTDNGKVGLIAWFKDRKTGKRVIAKLDLNDVVANGIELCEYWRVLPIGKGTCLEMWSEDELDEAVEEGATVVNVAKGL